MKIVDVQAIPLEFPLEVPSRDATGVWTSWNTVVVKVTAENGTSGYGEIGPVHGGGTLAYKALVDERLRPLLIGQNALERERLWHHMLGTGTAAYAFGRSGAIISAIAGVDIALWDLTGKVLGVPVCQLLGGRVHERIPAYASGFFGKEGRPLTPAECAAEAKQYADAGFKGVKMKVGFGRAEDIDNIEAVRNALGPGLGIMVDANQAFSFPEAKKLAEDLAAYGITFLEEPLPIHDREAMAALTAAALVPIAAGENYYTRFEFREVLVRRAVNIVQPDAVHVGGIGEMKKVATLASAWDVPLCPHIHATIGVAAAIQVMAATPNILAAEYITSGGSYRLRQALCGDACMARDGWVDVPDAPGLGVQVNERELERYVIQR